MLVDSKLITQLQLLTSAEFKNFEKWLKSPWCNSNKNLVRLYQILKPFYPDFDSQKLTKEKVFAKLYPNKAYNPPWMHNLMSELFKQVESFQVHDAISKNGYESKFLLSRVLLEKNKPDLFVKKSYELIQELDQKANKDLGDFYPLIFLYEQLYQMPEAGKGQSSAYAALSKFDHFLDQFYLLGKSRFFIEAVEGKLDFQKKFDFEQQLAYQEQLQKGLNSSTINAYQTYFKNRSELPKDRFAKLERAVLENFPQFHKKDKKLLLTLLINENARLLRMEGDQSALFKKAFELYEIGLSHDLLLTNGYMPVTTFVNIVTTSTFLKKTAYSARFMEEFHSKLDSQYRDDVYEWAQVYLAFNAGDPKLWMIAKKVIQAKPSNNHFAIRARVLVIQMWVEDFIQGKDQDVQFILDICLAFERQLDRNKFLSESHTNAYKKFVQYAKRLMNVAEKSKVSSEKLIKLEQSISSEANLHGKTWLILKMADLKARY